MVSNAAIEPVWIFARVCTENSIYRMTTGMYPEVSFVHNWVLLRFLFKSCTLIICNAKTVWSGNPDTRHRFWQRHQTYLRSPLRIQRLQLSGSDICTLHLPPALSYLLPQPRNRIMHQNSLTRRSRRSYLLPQRRSELQSYQVLFGGQYTQEARGG